MIFCYYDYCNIFCVEFRRIRKFPSEKYAIVWLKFLDKDYNTASFDLILGICNLGITCPVKVGTNFSALATDYYVPNYDIVAYLRVFILDANSDLSE